ncbi:MAG: hypothetical protein CR981_03480 [Proteobacteria bacterium]|nr:MAG: hypothetical protein CR981_03480 [Pseudomonadota bacterium]
MSSGQSFSALDGLVVGGTWSNNNAFVLENGATAAVTGQLWVGQASITNFSQRNLVSVSGENTRLTTTGGIDLNSGINGDDNALRISDGGVVLMNSDKTGDDSFDLYHHWVYGTSWLELGGGSLFLYGDKTSDYANDQEVLSSIKVWDETTGDFQAVASWGHAGTFILHESYFDMLAVQYIADEA